MAGASLLAMLLVFGSLTAISAVVLMAEGLLRPPRMNDGKAMYLLRRLSPGDLGLKFEETWFRLRDERGTPLRLAAWWIPAAGDSDRCVVLIHGYADAKVGAIAWAPMWHQLGFHVLAIDLRAHGESDGRYCTAGWFERHDIGHAIDQLLIDRPDQTRFMALFGVSFGASVAAATAAVRQDIRAIVLDSPYLDFTRAAMLQMDRLGAPGKLFQRASIWLAGRIAGADMASLSTTASIHEVRCPVMVVQSTADPALSAQDAEAIRQALELRSEKFPRDSLWQVQGTGHALALAADPDEYLRQLGRFLSGVGTRIADQRVAVGKTDYL